MSKCPPAKRHCETPEAAEEVLWGLIPGLGCGLIPGLWVWPIGVALADDSIVYKTQNKQPQKKNSNKTLGRAQDPRASGAWLSKLTV